MKYALIMANDIPSAKEDVKIMGKILKNFIIKICFDCNPQEEIINFCQKNILTSKDLLVIHYSGHGERIGKRINGKMEMISTWIYSKGQIYSYNIDRFLSTLKCQIVLLSDSCYSGNFGNHYFGNSLFIFIGSSSVNHISKEYNIKSKEKTGILVWIFQELDLNNLSNIQQTINTFTTKYKIKINPIVKVINEQILE